jgi:hypothetical protein
MAAVRHCSAEQACRGGERRARLDQEVAASDSGFARVHLVLVLWQLEGFVVCGEDAGNGWRRLEPAGNAIHPQDAAGAVCR